MTIHSAVGNDVPESANYTTVYQLNIPADGKFNDDPIPYSVDDSANIDFTFDRVAYHLELKKSNEERIWVFVSFPSLTMHADELGVPTFASGIVFNQLLTDVQIESNHPNLTSMGNIDTGVIEFWGTNISPNSNPKKTRILVKISTTTVFPIYGTPLGRCAAAYYIESSIAYCKTNS